MITLFSDVYKRQPYHFPEKLIPLMIANALNDKPLPVYGTGENVRDWLYVEDHCRAIDLIHFFYVSDSIFLNFSSIKNVLCNCQIWNQTELLIDNRYSQIHG